MYSVMTILSKNGGSMPIRLLMKEVEKSINLSVWENEALENTGNIRWQSIMHFTSVDYVRAGYLIKKKGVWIITPEGEEAIKLGALNDTIVILCHPWSFVITSLPSVFFSSLFYKNRIIRSIIRISSFYQKIYRDLMRGAPIHLHNISITFP